MEPPRPQPILTSVVKQYVTEQATPQKISQIEFGLVSDVDIRMLSEFEVVNRELYQHPTRIPVPNGPLDTRLGISDKSGVCGTCGKKLAECPVEKPNLGHFAYIKLELPVFHVGYFKAIIQVLQAICKGCSKVLLAEDDRRKYLRRLRSPKLETLQRRATVKAVLDRCKKTPICPHCFHNNGTVKKIGVLRIVHERYKGRSAEEVSAEFHREFDEAQRHNKDLKGHLSKAQEDLTPMRTLQLFRRVPAEDCELLDLKPHGGRPERMLLTHLLVPPAAIRPSVSSDPSQGGNEDDLTSKLMDIIQCNQALREKMQKGHPMPEIMELWDFLQQQCAMYINGDIPGAGAFSNVKPIRGLCIRLKGKGGRFRGNLSGKRVDFSGRTVISPDPNLNIQEVAIPMLIAKTLTYPERVTAHNIEKMRSLVLNGAHNWPGAYYVVSETNAGVFKTDLRYAKRDFAAQNLKPGDVVERHLTDGDIVLFNRQPSLHKLSIMAHRARVMPWRTLRFNECVCTPYNADFDGDEMNLHVPQTEEARAEAMVLMGVTENLITPRNGEPLIAATQDFLTASYLLTRKDTFMDRARFAQVCAFISDGISKVDLPPPAIIKPVRLWTGKQAFGVLIQPNKTTPISVNLEVKSRTFQPQWVAFDFVSGAVKRKPNGELERVPLPDLYLCPKDGYVCFSNSELVCGTLDKTTLGSGSKNNLFHVLMRDYGPEVAADRMSRLARVTSRWLANQGFSIGIADVTPSKSLLEHKAKLVATGYKNCSEYIEQYQKGTLRRQPGCDLEQSLEAKLNGELSDIRKKAGDECIDSLHWLNAPLIMALCGSKGSNINISQMVTCVGQQTVSGKRVPNGFFRRTLPHFGTDSRQPDAKGFVSNSFFSGMTPTEFFFHTMGGREGLVDTAVKTAETGYMQRRLMKALEDLSVQYDLTVRDSIKGVVQFTYGDDSLDPAGMEAKDRPVDMARVLTQVKALHPCPEEPSLSLAELSTYVDELLKTKLANANCSTLFLKELKYFFKGYHKEKKDGRPTQRGYIEDLKAFEERFATEIQKHRGAGGHTIVEKLHRVTRTQVDRFLDMVLEKYHRANIEPGTAVGALGAQSIGEPGTQMTLKTFHFAGVASMNITLGVPRIKEIINATKTISTPIISAMLVNDKGMEAARIVKGRIERTTLGEVISYVKEVYTPDRCYLSLKLDLAAIGALQLEINAVTVRRAILNAPKLKLKEKQVEIRSKDHIRIDPIEKSREQMFFSLQQIKNALPKVIVCGISTVERAIINEVKHQGATKYHLLVEGYNLGAVMATPGVLATETKSNNVIEVQHTLGIEAARRTIVHEIAYTMESHGISVDTRHLMLLADVMTYKGEVLGITRFGIGKMKDSVLMLASFEKTTDHLFDAAVHGRRDHVDGVSECIIMGTPVPLGTGIFKILRAPSKVNLIKRPPLLLDSPMSMNLGISK